MVEINLDTLIKAFRIMTRASIQSHNSHWDAEGNFGRTCPECIRAKKLREEAQKLWAEGIARKEET